MWFIGLSPYSNFNPKLFQGIHVLYQQLMSENIFYPAVWIFHSLLIHKQIQAYFILPGEKKAMLGESIYLWSLTLGYLS